MTQRVLLVVAFVLLASPVQAKVRKWNQKMQQMAKIFTEILPDTVSSRHLTPAEVKKLEKNTKKLADLAHTINVKPGEAGKAFPPEADPTIGFVSGLFERDIKHAYRTLQAGHVDYARAVLRNATAYCIACHTRHDFGPEFPTIEMPANSASLSPMERAELLAATRQFDKALDEFSLIAGDPKTATARPAEWGKAVRNALTLSVRVKQDPDRALKVLTQVGSLPNQPAYFKENIAAWKKSVEEWKVEKSKVINTEEGLFSEAMRLTEAARQMQAYPLDHSADVLYLRASLAAHELLTLYPKGKRASEALFLVGNAYDLLQDKLVSPLPDMYYEACIRTSPHTEIAKRCYRRIEENVFFGWTGSAGTSLPPDLVELLKSLLKLATPATPEP